jgi:hypothetical protein
VARGQAHIGNGVLDRSSKYRADDVENRVDLKDWQVYVGFRPLDDERVELLEQLHKGVAVCAPHILVGRKAAPRGLDGERQLAKASRQAVVAKALANEADGGEEVGVQRVANLKDGGDHVARTVLVCARARAGAVRRRMGWGDGGCAPHNAHAGGVPMPLTEVRAK